MSTLEEFAAKIDKRSYDECWEWLAAKSSQGYGMVKVGHKVLRAHRVSWELFFGPIPKDKSVLHKCDNPGCVNPYHMYLGDARDNANDAVRHALRNIRDNHNEQSVSAFALALKRKEV